MDLIAASQTPSCSATTSTISIHVPLKRTQPVQRDASSKPLRSLHRRCHRVRQYPIPLCVRRRNVVIWCSTTFTTSSTTIIFSRPSPRLSRSRVWLQVRRPTTANTSTSSSVRSTGHVPVWRSEPICQPPNPTPKPGSSRSTTRPHVKSSDRSGVGHGGTRSETNVAPSSFIDARSDCWVTCRSESGGLAAGESIASVRVLRVLLMRWLMSLNGLSLSLPVCSEDNLVCDIDPCARFPSKDPCRASSAGLFMYTYTHDHFGQFIMYSYNRHMI